MEPFHCTKGSLEEKGSLDYYSSLGNPKCFFFLLYGIAVKSLS